MMMQPASAGTVWAKAFNANPSPTNTYPAASTRRVENRRVMVVSGNSQSTTMAPFMEINAP